MCTVCTIVWNNAAAAKVLAFNAAAKWPRLYGCLYEIRIKRWGREWEGKENEWWITSFSGLLFVALHLIIIIS